MFLLCALFVTKNGNATFSIENDTGVSCYKIYLSQKQVDVEDFRIRVTFDEIAKDHIWLTEHRSEINRIDLPDLHGVISKPLDIRFPDKQSDNTKFITLYVTASCCNEERSATFLNATTYELPEVTPIDNILVKFKSIDPIDKSLNVELNINGSAIITDNSFIKKSTAMNRQVRSAG